MWEEPERPPRRRRRPPTPSRPPRRPRARSTEPVDVLAERDADDDAYLAELRKAMTDESPLGPREEGDIDPLFDAGTEPTRSRFGRRR